jgi:hypothetical protein
VSDIPYFFPTGVQDPGFGRVYATILNPGSCRVHTTPLNPDLSRVHTTILNPGSCRVHTTPLNPDLSRVHTLLLCCDLWFTRLRVHSNFFQFVSIPDSPRCWQIESICHRVHRF